MSDPADDTVIDDDFLGIMGNVDMDYVRRMVEIERNRPPEFHGSDTSDEFDDYFDDDSVAEPFSESVADTGALPQYVIEDRANVRGPDYIIERARIQQENRVRLAALAEEMALRNDPWIRYKRVLWKTVGGVGLGVAAYMGCKVTHRLAHAAKGLLLAEISFFLRR